MSLEPYLCLAGVEIGNAQRVLGYVRNGLAGARWRAEDTAAYTVATPPTGEYIDEYLDEYLGGGEEGVNSQVAFVPSCPCPGLGVAGDYDSPGSDPAPWYEATRAVESGEFLGFLPDLVDLLPVVSRSVVARADVGGVLGRQRRRARIVQVSGVMLATSRRGMSWGERWLSEALAGSLCEPLRGDVAEVLPACPPESTSDGDAEDWLRTLRGVGLVDGPLFAAEGAVPTCYLQRATFQLVAANPYLHAPATTHVDGQQVSDAGSVSAEVETGEWLAGAAVSVVIEATEDTTDVVVTATPMVDGQTCPATGVAACVTYRVPLLDEGATLTLDAVDRFVSSVDASSKTETSGMGLLEVEGPFGWIDIPPCTSMCVTVAVEGTGTVVVTITSTNREL